jgi:hypothetical protein
MNRPITTDTTTRPRTARHEGRQLERNQRRPTLFFPTPNAAHWYARRSMAAREGLAASNSPVRIPPLGSLRPSATTPIPPRAPHGPAGTPLIERHSFVHRRSATEHARRCVTTRVIGRVEFARPKPPLGSLRPNATTPIPPVPPHTLADMPIIDRRSFVHPPPKRDRACPPMHDDTSD